MPLKKFPQKTTLISEPDQTPREPEITGKDQCKIIDPENLKVELSRQNEAFKKILARLEKKKQP
jgi:hypothetical protein